MTCNTITSKNDDKMFTDEEKKSVLQRILQSRHFKDSPIYTNLLQYLVESTLSKNIPKEITIAIDVFGKDASFNLNKDATVRYHIHILRKKLDDYYKDEGKSDEIRLIIPKGHYEVQYIYTKDQKAPKSSRIVSYIKRWEIAVILLLLLLNIYLLYRQINSNRISPTPLAPNFVDSNDEIWGSFFENDYPILIILGDDFLLDEYCPEFKRYRQIRDWEIDSENDLYNFLIQYPKANMWKSEITGIPFGGTNNLMDILPIAYQFQSNISLKMSSTLALEEIRNHNIIYIGEFKNLRVLTKIIFKTPIRYQYRPDERLFIVNEKSDTLNTFLRVEAPYEQKNKYNIDYSLLIKIPGFTNENFMFIVGFGYGGRLQRTKMLANAELRAGFVEEIRKINTNVPEYFITVFEVKSIERTGFTNEIKYFKEVSRDFFD
jgi:hypothetical protein